MTSTVDVTGTMLNHVEFLHRPGESDLVLELLQVLGCRCEVVDAPEFGKYIIVHMGDVSGENDFFASEAEPEQLEFEDALQREIESAGSDVAAGFARYRSLLQDRPYRATHIGIRLPSVAVFDDVLERLESLSNGRFAGRLVTGYSINRTPEDARASGRPLKQRWVWTNLISTGLLTAGQQIEIQTYAP